MVILGTQYAGEMKKGIFTVMHYLMPKIGILSLHSGCNEGKGGDVTLFFGLSGTSLPCQQISAMLGAASLRLVQRHSCDVRHVKVHGAFRRSKSLAAGLRVNEGRSRRHEISIRASAAHNTLPCPQQSSTWLC